MRSKLSIALLLGLIVAGAGWALNGPTVKAEPVSSEGFGCCVTGDCCCPGQGDCCAAVKVSTEGKGCCAKTEAKKVGCCGNVVKAEGKGCCATKAKTEAKTNNTEAVSVKVGGCCATGNCCCPLAGLCCDPFAKLTATFSPVAASDGEGCCVTGDCCCPGQGACCGFVKARADN